MTMVTITITEDEAGADLAIRLDSDPPVLSEADLTKAHHAAEIMVGAVASLANRVEITTEDPALGIHESPVSGL